MLYKYIFSTTNPSINIFSVTRKCEDARLIWIYCMGWLAMEDRPMGCLATKEQPMGWLATKEQPMGWLTMEEQPIWKLVHWVTVILFILNHDRQNIKEKNWYAPTVNELAENTKLIWTVCSCHPIIDYWLLLMLNYWSEHINIDSQLTFVWPSEGSAPSGSSKCAPELCCSVIKKKSWVCLLKRSKASRLSDWLRIYCLIYLHMYIYMYAIFIRS